MPSPRSRRRISDRVSSLLKWRRLLIAITFIPLFLFLLQSPVFLTVTNHSPLSLSVPESLKTLLPISSRSFVRPTEEHSAAKEDQITARRNRKKEELNRSKIAICLVGGARRFELTGHSIIKNLLEEYSGADLFLNSPFDNNSYKFAILGSAAPRIAAVRISAARHVPETRLRARVLSASNSPNGIQGLLQYFDLVEGCLDLIRSHESRSNLTYDWIARTRVDSYWSAPLDPLLFDPSHYLLPAGSHFGGLNDRLGIGTASASFAALSRLSLLPRLHSAGYRHLNSESAFRAQLSVSQVPYREVRFPFCIVSERRYGFPPGEFGVPVASMGSKGALSGAKCRPCSAGCVGECAERVMRGLKRGWGWVPGGSDLELCDGSGEWEGGWEEVFDEAAGEEAVGARRWVGEMDLEGCVREFEGMRKRVAGSWEAPTARVVCELGVSL